MIKHKYTFYLLFFTFFCEAQKTSIGFFYGPSIGYNSTYEGLENPHGLFDINFDTGESFFTTIQMMDDNDLSYNIEAINGHTFGLKANLFVNNYIKRIKENLKRVKKLPKIKGVKRIYFPGENKVARLKENSKKEISIPSNILYEINLLNKS